MTKFILAMLILSVNAVAQPTCNDVFYMSTARWQRVAGVSPHEAALVKILTFRPSGEFVEVDTWVARDKASTDVFLTLGEGYVVRRGIWKWLTGNRVLVDSHVDSSEGFVIDESAWLSKKHVYLVGQNAEHVFGSNIALGTSVFTTHQKLKNAGELQVLIKCVDKKG